MPFDEREPMNKIVTVRMTESEKAILDAAAVAHGKDVVEIIRSGLKLWFEANPSPTTPASADAVKPARRRKA